MDLSYNILSLIPTPHNTISIFEQKIKTHFLAISSHYCYLKAIKQRNTYLNNLVHALPFRIINKNNKIHRNSQTKKRFLVDKLM